MPDSLSGTRRVTVLCYTQTGQLREAVAAFTAPLVAAGWTIRWVDVVPDNEFPFPWSIRSFFGVFAASTDPRATVALRPPAAGFHTEPDELVILAAQVWFLSPSLPVRALLTDHPELFADRDVLAFMVCRDKWYSAAVEMRTVLDGVGARFAGVVAATDTSRHLISMVTTLRWMLLGKRQGFLGFPAAGVGEHEHERLRTAGRAIAAAAAPSDRTAADVVTRALPTVDAAPVEPLIAGADLMAGRLFRTWGAAVRAAGRIGPAAYALVLAMFVGWLGIAIGVGLPVVSTVRRIGKRYFEPRVRRRVATALHPTPRPRPRTGPDRARSA
ncbi:hypothetical protein [Nocardia huaxiensis]|uniref:hypothetical protein n=1 Tax=Nocardia huaxiensis TaxID=2755382 RepID=UPI001E5920BA|nr:hypothetical protein [Nocardia huaxiensis]UFS96842.1 hypothetical protein LPY97_02615 [Nocardia huaxiensis]